MLKGGALHTGSASVLVKKAPATGEPPVAMLFLEKGTFSVPDLEPGRYLVSVVPFTELCGGLMYSREIVVEADGPAILDLDLPDTDLEIALRDAATGKPLEGLDLTLSRNPSRGTVGGLDFTLMLAGRTGEDGVFRMSGIPPGEYRVVIRAPDHRADPETITVKAVGLTRWDRVLAPGEKD